MVVNPYSQPGPAGGGNDWYNAGPQGGAPAQSPDGLNWGPSVGAPAPMGGGGVPTGPFGQMGAGPAGGGVMPPQPPGGMMQPAQQPGFFPPPGGNIGGPAPTPIAAQQGDDEFLNEPPILEELGVNVDQLVERLKGVAMFKGVDHELMADADMSGPLVIALCIGVCMLLAGKLNFGYLYGIGMVGCLGTWLVTNGLSQREAIDMYRVMSILGYGLLPILLLAFVNIFVSLKGVMGLCLAPVCIFWSTATASRFFAVAITMNNQRWLVAYPVGLVYALFVLITVF